MSPTTIADPTLIPDIEAFEERVAIHIHEWYSNRTSQGPRSPGPRLPQSGPLLGLVEGLCGKEETWLG